MRGAVLALVLLGGCTTIDTRDTAPFHLASSRSKVEVAQCIVDNAEKLSGRYAGHIVSRGSFVELTVRHPDSGQAILASVADSGIGSRARIWISPQHRVDRDGLVREITQGCQ
jgi:hypothetical protein